MLVKSTEENPKSGCISLELNNNGNTNDFSQ